MLIPSGEKVESLRTRVGVVCERKYFLCLSASANRKKVADVLPYGFSLISLYVCKYVCKYVCMYVCIIICIL